MDPFPVKLRFSYVRPYGRLAWYERVALFIAAIIAAVVAVVGLVLNLALYGVVAFIIAYGATKGVHYAR